MKDAWTRRSLHTPRLIAGAIVCCCVLRTFPACADSIRESAREIPVAYRVDVVVIGGSSAAVAAAEAAAQGGARVFLAAPRNYLGEDLCATLRLELDAGQMLTDSLAQRLFPAGRSTTPLTVKRVLDETLVAAGVRFLHGCYATDILRDRDGRPAGIVMANRAGRQAVVAKLVIDATDRAWATRAAGAASAPWPQGEQTFERTVLVPAGRGKAKPVVRQLALSLTSGDFAAWAAAEQAARDQTYVDGQLRAAESLFHVPSEAIVCRAGPDEWKGAEACELGHFQPAQVERWYVLGGAAGVPRAAAAALLRPTGLIAVARRIGAAAAEQANELPEPRGVRLPGTPLADSSAGDVAELLRGLRPVGEPDETIPAEARSVPVWGRYDVLVIGGGTAGASAAIGAARRGAKTLVVEYQEALGGTGTLGLITRPYHGRLAGFAREVPFPDPQLNVEHKMEWFRREIRQAGGEIWLGALGCGAWLDGARVRGAVVATPQGRGVVLADCVIDATGNADLAAAAGAKTEYGAGEQDVAMQGAGLPPRPLDRQYVNTDYLLVDEADMLDAWRALVGARQAMKPTEFDAGTLIQTRERQRIVGDHRLTYLDQIAGRTYPDSIVLSASDYDSHGYPVQAYFALFPHDERTIKANHPAPGGECYTPYRCLLPRGLDGILVVGIALSADRDALAMVRMQRDIQNQGYAAGVAAAMIAAADLGTRQLDVRALQQHLVAIGNLPESVLSDRDSFPLSAEAVQQAVVAVGQTEQRQQACHALAVVLSHAQTALPLLQARHAAADPREKQVYAKILGFLGDAAVVPELVEALDQVTAWDAKILQGKMAEYAHLPTPSDSLILALGATADSRAVPAILRKLETLDADVTLSHHRAVALALEQIGDPAAAEPLARLLRKPGMTGHTQTSLVALPEGMAERRDRTAPLREIVLARALFRCGDWHGLGRKILEDYQHDWRGLLARHAVAVLASSRCATSEAP